MPSSGGGVHPIAYHRPSVAVQVTVRQGDDIIVGFLNSDMMVQLTDNPALHEVVEDASARLQRVREALQG
jgi:hypothetical protein